MLYQGRRERGEGGARDEVSGRVMGCVAFCLLAVVGEISRLRRRGSSNLEIFFIEMAVGLCAASGSGESAC